jgi:L-iditol 2-dehydrogenase
MRAAVLTGPRRVELRDTEAPVPAEDEVVVAVDAVGICGTDLSIHAGKIPVAYPRVMGHEVVGTLDSSATPVLVDPGIVCGRCGRCLEGRENICTEGWLLGRDRDGALRERLAVRSSNVHPLPDAVDPRVAPLVQVLATCVHAQHRSPPAPGERVVVVGLGVTGLLHVQLAKLAGADQVVGVTRSAAKLELAGALGADALVRADGTESEEVAAIVPGGADLVIECVGTVEALGRSIEMTRTGGRILAYGTITATTGSMPFYDVYHKELTISGARSARAQDFPAAIDAVASGRVDLASLVSARFPLAEVDAALAAAAAPGALKVLVDV